MAKRMVKVLPVILEAELLPPKHVALGIEHRNQWND